MQPSKTNHRFILLKLIRHDICAGILRQHKKAITITVLFIVYFYIFYLQLNYYVTTYNFSSSLTMMDIYYYIFKGMLVYIPTPKTSFPIPIQWLIVHISLALFILGYANKDRTGNGQHFLIRSRSRVLWWISKCFWIICVVFIFYILSYIVIFLSAYIFGSISFNFSSELWNKMFGLYVPNTINFSELLTLIMLPIFTSTAISFCQMTVEIWFNPIVGFISVLCILVASAYFFTPWLIGNNGMLQRSVIMMSNGIDFKQACLTNGATVLLSFILGLYGFIKKDVLP